MALSDSFQMIKRHQFLFEELVKRDFKRKYKRAALGIFWSVLSPLLMLLVLKIVFTQFFGRTVAHYTTYLFCGQLVFHYFSDSASAGMSSLMSNSAIIGKVKVPKCIFLFARNAQTFLSFLIILVVFFAFCLFDDITFSWKFLLLTYPILTLTLFNVGIGLVLSALYVFFRDMQYLWQVFVRLLFYGSAIMYSIDGLAPETQALFKFNPVYMHIAYFRQISIAGSIPSVSHHLVLLGTGLLAFAVGMLVFRKCDDKFLYYI